MISSISAELQAAIDSMSAAIRQILGGNGCSIYIYGSVALGDFRFGWSDVDILCLTEEAVSEKAAVQLVDLRQSLLRHEKDNPYYRSFEGAIVCAEEFLTVPSCKAVYWGTSGQRITDAYMLDCFSRKELMEVGIRLCGREYRPKMEMPDRQALWAGIRHHYATIRQYAVQVSRSLYSYGWMLDIARCLYTLQTGEIIAKTAAAEWALAHSLCPVPQTLERTLLLRRDPLRYREDADMLSYTERLGADIQRFADVLETELNRE